MITRKATMPPEDDEGEQASTAMMSWHHNSNSINESIGSGAEGNILEGHQREQLRTPSNQLLQTQEGQNELDHNDEDDDDDDDDAVDVPERPGAHPLEQREQSAEEVMEASLSFRQSGRSSQAMWLASSNSELYPNPFLENDVMYGAVVSSSDQRLSPRNNFHDDESAPVAAAGQGVAYSSPSVVEERSPVAAFASLNNHDAYAAAAAAVTDMALDDEDELIAYKRRVAAGGGGFTHAPLHWSAADDDTANTMSALVSDQEALVVDITEHFVHPSDLTQNDARAELIGEDYTRSMEDLPRTPRGVAFRPLYNSYESYLTEFHATPGSATILGDRPLLADFTATPGEAVVLDTVLMVEEEQPSAAWCSPYSEAAHAIDDSIANSLERKLPAVNRRHDHRGGMTDTGTRNLNLGTGLVLAEEEGEVVGITEDVHPSELRGESVAEFIGSNFNVAIESDTAIRRSSNGHHVGTTEHATIVGITDDDVRSAVIEDDRAISSAIIDMDESPVALAMLPGVPFDHEERTISEAQVLPNYSAPSDEYPLKPPAVLSDATMMEAADQSVGRNRQTLITFSEPPEIPIPPRQDGFVIVSSGDFDDVSCGASSRPRGTDPNVEGTPIPQSSAFNPQRDVSTTSTGDGSNFSRTRSEGSASQRSSLQQLSSNLARSTNTVIEKLFGDTPPSFKRPDFEIGDTGGNISPRTLLPWSVFRNEANGMWVVTLNTNQKALDSNNVTEASKALKAFSVPTEKQAMALARSWAPPKMLPFHENPSCFTCETKFAVFRRACHCRNCGVCICSRCAIQWPSKMIPETYNIKKESLVNICKACDWLCTGFRLSLLEGDFDHAVAMHATGNVNLVTPFANVKGELFYPVHCAVIGGSLQLLKWLVDEMCCPLRSIRISGKHRDPSNSFTPILTSRGRSLLSIAMEMKHVPVIRYLVVDKGMSISAERNVTVDTITQTLHLVLQMLPDNIDEQQSNNYVTSLVVGDANNHEVALLSLNQQGGEALPDSPLSQYLPQPQSPIPPPDVAAQHLEAIYGRGGFDDDDESSTDDMCIICFSNRIDCVVTPCGHQICCLQCSNNISRCPVCSVDCSFMRVFKA